MFCIFVALSIVQPMSKKYTLDQKKGSVGGFGKDAYFLGASTFLTIQKHQLGHSARTGSRCRMGAKVASRELKAALFKCTFFYNGVTGVWWPSLSLYCNLLIVPNVLHPKLSVLRWCVPNGIRLYNTVVALMLTLSHVLDASSGAAGAVSLHVCVVVLWVCVCVCVGSKRFWVHMNNALLYCGIVNLYSYCNVYREILEGCLVFKKVLSCNKVDVLFCGVFMGSFWQREAQEPCTEYIVSLITAQIWRNTPNVSHRRLKCLNI